MRIKSCLSVLFGEAAFFLLGGGDNLRNFVGIFLQCPFGVPTCGSVARRWQQVRKARILSLIDNRNLHMNLFIVENSNYLRERLARLVEQRRGIQVVGHAASAREAVDLIRQTRPDVVLLDIRLDQGTGLDVVRQLKTRGQPPVFVVLTNYAYKQYRDRFKQYGAEYFFDKSQELDVMLQALDTLRHRFPDGARQAQSNSQSSVECRSVVRM